MPFVPIAAIGTMLFLAVYLFTHYPMAWAAAGGWIAAGAGVYYGYSRTRESAFVERREWMDRIDRKEYRVLVAVSNPRTMESLLEAGAAIASRYGGEVIALKVAEVPEGLTLIAGRRLARAAEPVLERAVATLGERGIAARPVVRIARRVSHGILETAREEGCNFIILGGPKSQSVFERVVASIVELVLRDAPCQVGVVYGSIRPGSLRRVVLPVTASRNSRLAADLAPAFAGRFGATTRAVTVVPAGGESEESRRLVAEARETLSAAGLEQDVEVLHRRDVGRALSDSILTGDLVLLGAPGSGPVAGLLVATVPAILAGHGRNPVIVVRDVEKKQASRFERVFFRKG